MTDRLVNGVTAEEALSDLRAVVEALGLSWRVKEAASRSGRWARGRSMATVWDPGRLSGVRVAVLPRAVRASGSTEIEALRAALARWLSRLT